MKKFHWIIFLVVCATTLPFLLGCGAQKEPEKSGVNAPSGADRSWESDVSFEATKSQAKQEVSNMVDERFELLSLVFRLAGREEYSEVSTKYQQSLVSEFDRYKDHEAVQYAAGLPLGYDAAFYQSNIDFYKTETKRFIDSTYSEIDFEWFGTYVDADNLRCVYSPSSTQQNYGATIPLTPKGCQATEAAKS